MGNRIKLYIISLWLLFFLIIFKEFKWDMWCDNEDVWTNLKVLISNNLLSTSAFILLVLGIIFLFDLRYKVKGTLDLPKKVEEIKNLNYEHLTFLTTYIIPFICFELDDLRNTFIFVFLLVIIGAIYVKTNLFYSNPTLALLGYHIYQVNTATETEMILITQGKLTKGQSFSDLEVGDTVYYAKQINKPKSDE